MRQLLLLLIRFPSTYRTRYITITLYICINFVVRSAVVFFGETFLSGCTNDRLTRCEVQMERLMLRANEKPSLFGEARIFEYSRHDYYLCFLSEKGGMRKKKVKNITYITCSPMKRTCTCYLFWKKRSLFSQSYKQGLYAHILHKTQIY